MRSHRSINKLKEGETLEVEGIIFVKEEGEISVGDWYIAERNQGPKLLTCRKIVDPSLEGGTGGKFVVPVENAYPYDLWECVKVKIVE